MPALRNPLYLCYLTFHKFTQVTVLLTAVPIANCLAVPSRVECADASIQAGDAMNIDRGFTRLFIVAFILGLVPLLLITHNKPTGELREHRKSAKFANELLETELAKPACQNIVLMKGKNMDTSLLQRDGECRFIGVLWDRAIALGENSHSQLGDGWSSNYEEAFKDVVETRNNEIERELYLSMLIYVIGWYTAIFLFFYGIYKLIYWAFAGFKSK